MDNSSVPHFLLLKQTVQFYQVVLWIFIYVGEDEGNRQSVKLKLHSYDIQRSRYLFISFEFNFNVFCSE